MGKNNMFVASPAQAPAPVVTTPPQARVLERRVAAPAPVQTNPAVAKAAPTKTASVRKAAPLNDVLKMSDEEFMKQYGDKY